MKKIVLLLTVYATLSLSATAQTYNLQIGQSSVLAEFPDNNQALFRPFNTTAGSTGGIKLFELAANGSNYVGFRAPDLLSGDYLYVLPNGYGTNGYFLQTDGAGNLTWAGGASLFTAGTGLSWSGTTLNSVWTVNGTHIYNNNTGNVGMGAITSPATLLHIGSTADATTDTKIIRVQTNGYAGLELLGDNSNAGSEPGGAYVRLGQDNNAVAALLGVIQSSNGNGAGGTLTGSIGNSVGLTNTWDDATGHLHLGTRNIVRMTVAGTGNVGIATTAPANTLQIGQNTASNNTDYSLSILRHGVAATPGIYTASNPSLFIQDFSGDGPATLESLAMVQISAPRIADADPNAANALLLNVSNDNGSALAVAGNRRVGIGTTSPTQSLDVNGQIRMRTGASAGYVPVSSADGTMTWTAPGSIGAGDNLGNHTATTTLNMVGNAISNAVQINSSSDHIELMGNRTDDNSYEWLGFYSGATRQGIILYDGAWGGANSLTNEFSISSENNNKLTLNTNNGDIALMPKVGNVGIGTLTPGALLHVGTGSNRYATISSTGLITGRFDDNSTPAILTLENRAITAINHGVIQNFGLNIGSGSSITSGQIRVSAEDTYAAAANQDAYMTFSTASNGTLGERVRINSSGNVGINNTAPGNKMDIVGGAARSGTHPTGLALYATATSSPAASGVEFRHDNGTQGIGFGYNTIYATGSNANQDLGFSARGASGHLIFNANGAERARLEASGNFGIATGATPTQRLDVNGQIRMRTGAAAGYIPVSSADGTMTWTAPGSIGAGDNLGNHTATSALEMAGYNVNNAIQLNSNGDHLEFMRNRTNDNSYEWLGFYSGGTRQGIILYDGAWGGANNLTDEFSITAEAGNRLTLNTESGYHINLMPKGTGNVGINSLTPAYKLDVVGDARISGNLGVGNAPPAGAGGTSGLGIALPSTANDNIRIFGEHDGSDGSNGIFYTNDNTNDGWYFRNVDCCGSGTLDYMRIARDGVYYIGSGNFGIGTSSPAQKLDVNGKIALRGVRLEAFFKNPLSGGGNLKWQSNVLSWTGRIIVIPAGDAGAEHMNTAPWGSNTSPTSVTIGAWEVAYMRPTDSDLSADGGSYNPIQVASYPAYDPVEGDVIVAVHNGDNGMLYTGWGVVMPSNSVYTNQGKLYQLGGLRGGWYDTYSAFFDRPLEVGIYGPIDYTNKNAGGYTTYIAFKAGGAVVCSEGSGNYYFRTCSDDGSDIFLDNSRVMTDFMNNHPETCYQAGPYNYTAGSVIPLAIQHRQGTGGSVIRLQWYTPNNPSWHNIDANSLGHLPQNIED